MSMPGFTAEASMYKSVVTYVMGQTEVPVKYESGVTPQQLMTVGRFTVNPIKPPWLCRNEYWLCRGFVPTCIDRCISDGLGQCAIAPDPQACGAGVAMRCSGSCIAACDAQYARCLSGQG
jgi:hypothetical protein